MINRIVAPGFSQPTKIFELVFNKEDEPTISKSFEGVITFAELAGKLEKNVLTLVDNGYPQIRDELKQLGFWVGDIRI